MTPPTNLEIKAMAMLLGEECMICSCCLGRQQSRGLFGGMRRCKQCHGTGFDILGPKTCEAIGLNERGYFISDRRVF